MATETWSSNSLSVSTRLTQRKSGLQGLKNGASHRVERSHAPTDSVREALFLRSLLPSQDESAAAKHPSALPHGYGGQQKSLDAGMVASPAGPSNVK